MADETTRLDLGTFNANVTTYGGSGVSASDNLYEGWAEATLRDANTTVEVPTVAGATGHVLSYKGSVNSEAALPRAGEPGDTYHVTSIDKSVMWTGTKWSVPFSWKGEAGEAGPPGPRADTLDMTSFRYKTVGSFNLLPRTEKDGAIYVVSDTGHAHQYRDGAWSSGFPYRGPEGLPGPSDKGPAGDKGYPADPIHIVGADDWENSAGTGTGVWWGFNDSDAGDNPPHFGTNDSGCSQWMRYEHRTISSIEPGSRDTPAHSFMMGSQGTMYGFIHGTLEFKTTKVGAVVGVSFLDINRKIIAKTLTTTTTTSNHANFSFGRFPFGDIGSVFYLGGIGVTTSRKLTGVRLDAQWLELPDPSLISNS